MYKKEVGFLAGRHDGTRRPAIEKPSQTGLGIRKFHEQGPV